MPFMGTLPLRSVDAEPVDVILFGAPHGTPYPGIDNEAHAATAEVLRAASNADGDWSEHWNYDVGGPLFGQSGLRVGDLGDLPTQSQDGAGNRRGRSRLEVYVPGLEPMGTKRQGDEGFGCHLKGRTLGSGRLAERTGTP